MNPGLEILSYSLSTLCGVALGLWLVLRLNRPRTRGGLIALLVLLFATTSQSVDLGCLVCWLQDETMVGIRFNPFMLAFLVTAVIGGLLRRKRSEIKSGAAA
ncbi:hypothetical protein KQH51_01100 [bacterium]|nr:hypothetical protein [bacterium]MCB2201521.1 hypothetical protein [bacterium]